MANSQTFTLNIKAVADMKDVQTNIQNIQNALKQLKLPTDTQNSFKKTFGDLEKEFDKYQKLMAGGIKTKGDASKLETSGNNIVRLYDKIVKTINSLDNSTLKKAFEDMGGKEVENLRKELEGLQSDLKKEVSGKKAQFFDFTQAKQDINKFKSTITGLSDDAQRAFNKLTNSTFNTFTKNLSEGNLQLAANNLNSMAESAEKVGNTDLIKWVKDLQDAFANLQKDGDISPLLDKINKVKQSLSATKTDTIKNLVDQFNKGKIDAQGLADSIRKVTSADADLGKAQAQTNKELDQVKSRIQYFFGLNNAINLVKRAIRGAVDTIKELDKAMTATAVVTDFSVSDMWEQLPEYTKRANELGVSTLAAYEAATLYYQQGLKTEDVNALSVETLKMARIAGLEAAEATDRMTNALRGFNMELTEANAQRVDDVYSELAANTASNVDEISTAMTKVASLAHNANMEFETTSAFLAQIIETTRESAETAGTALKTVVARFSEVKKLIDTNQLQGQDEEGQIVDVNRVGQALRTAGIDLNKYFLGEVGLDDIFMELASKWDSLTSVQQRYIATQAAGSRQQSRFIALMSDYARTQELVGKAYNAEGASAKQFAKTQESLESKLNRLKNAWNEFLMGLTNNEMVKHFVDLLTNLLNTINKLTSAFGESGSSIAKWALAFGAIKGGKALFNSSGFDSILSLFTGKSRAGGRAGLGRFLLGGGIPQGQNEAGTQIYSGVNGGVVGGLNSLGNKVLDLFRKKTAEGLTKGVSSAAAGLTEAATETLGQQTGEVINSVILDKTGKPFQKVITNATSAGVETGIKVGVEAGGKAAETAAGAGASAAGAAGVSLGAVATALGVVALAVGAVITAYQLWLKLTPEGQLKYATQLASALNEVAASADKIATNLKNAYSEYENYNSAVEEAITSTQKLNAEQERTKYIGQLLKDNPFLAQYVTASQEGGEFKLTIDKDGFKKAVEDAEKAATLMAANNAFANASMYGAQANVYANRREKAGVNLTDKTITRKSYAAGEGESVIVVETVDKMTDAEYAKYSNERLAEIQALTLEQQSAKQGILQLLSGQGIEDDIANLIAEGMAKGYDSKTQQKEVRNNRRENWWIKHEGDLQSLRRLYKELTGTDADLSINRKSLAIAVAELQANKSYQTQAMDIANILTGSQGQQYKDIIEAATGTGKITEQNLDDSTLESYVNKLFEGIETSDELAKIASALTNTKVAASDATKVLKEHIKNQYKDTQLLNQANRERIYSTLLASGSSIDQTQVERINKLQPGESEQFANILENAKNLIPANMFDKLTNDLLNSIGTPQAEAIQNLFSSINLDDAISAFITIQKAEKNATNELKPYIEGIKTANADLFSSSGLVQSFIASADYDNITKQLDKLIKKNKDLTAENIKDIAEECDKLQTLLDSNVVSARALAKAFTLVQTGKLSFEQLNESVLKALESATSFKDMISEVTSWIKDFDKGTDLKEGTKHIGDSVKELKELVSNWEFGNEPTEKIYDHLFGKDKYQTILQDYINDTKKDFAGAEKAITAEATRIAKLAENEGLGGIQQAAGKVSGLTGSGTNFEWDLSQFSTTAEAIDQVAKTLEVSREAAEAFILSWQTHMPGLRTSWDELAVDTRLKTFADTLTDTAYVSAQQLRALSDETGRDVDEIQKKLAELRGDNEITIFVNWKDKNGNDLTSTNFLDEYKKTIMGGSSDWKSEASKYTSTVEADIELNKGKTGIPTDALHATGKQIVETLDIDKLIASSIEKGLSEAQTKELANKLVETTESGLMSATITVPVEEDGIVKSIEKEVVAADWDALQAEINAELEAANYDLMAQKLASGDYSGLEGALSSATKNGAYKGTIAGFNSAKTIIEGQTLNIKAKILASGGGVTRDVNYSEAAGGIVQSYASGTHKVAPGVALTGEEGPEIVWNKKEGYAYITGENGAEFKDLKPGDHIFNAAETQRIFRNSSLASGGDVFPSYAGKPGAWKKERGKGSGGSSSGAGSGSDKDNEWKNDLDWLYNVMENIAELERQQTDLQEQYDDLLKDQAATGHDLYKMLIQQLGNLQAQLDHQTYTLERREQEMREFMDTTNDQDEYLWYNWEDRTLEIDWDKIDQITDQEKYDHIKDLISEAESIQDKMDDAEDAIIDIENQIQELENIWRDTFTEFEERVLDAIVKMYQTVIDNYSELNSTLNESNQAILDSIQKEISLQRQIRDNTKTEQEIADNEARLAYIQRDTTGGNDLAALQMGRELEDQRESYSDSLIDQAIQKLQDDNDAAAQQREKQIEIMQAQLDYQAENGEFNAYIRELMETAIDPDGHLATDSALYKLLAEQENADAMTKVQRDVWEEELTGTFKEVLAFLLKEQGEAEGSYFTAVTAAFNGISDTFDKAFHGSYSQGSAHGSKSSGSGGDSEGKTKKRVKDKDENDNDNPNYIVVPSSGATLKKEHYEDEARRVADIMAGNTKNNSTKRVSDITNNPKVAALLKKKKYATGGLNTQTGLAWLDGTPSEPEYVLNARQTDAFLKLADVLPTAMSPQNSGNSTVFGDTTNNIVINVDRIDSDYSVDQMVDRVKEKLFETGSYRNNNVLSLLR